MASDAQTIFDGAKKRANSHKKLLSVHVVGPKGHTLKKVTLKAKVATREPQKRKKPRPRSSGPSLGELISRRF